jgi:hypothetical protein
MSNRNLILNPSTLISLAMKISNKKSFSIKLQSQLLMAVLKDIMVRFLLMVKLELEKHSRFKDQVLSLMEKNKSMALI